MQNESCVERNGGRSHCSLTSEQLYEEAVGLVDGRVCLGRVEITQRLVGVHHAQGVVDEQGVVVLPEVERTLCQQSFSLFHT